MVRVISHLAASGYSPRSFDTSKGHFNDSWTVPFIVHLCCLILYLFLYSFIYS